MLQKIAKTGKKMLLSSGMSSYFELDKTLEFLGPFENELAVFQCTTEYPTPPENLGLNIITEMKQRYNLPVGLSDHSGKIYSGLAAVSMGIEYLEVHTCFDRRMFGPDSQSSLTIDEIRQLVEGVRFLEKAIRNPVDKNETNRFSDLKEIFGKSLAVNKDLDAGSELSFEDLESKKPWGAGIETSRFKEFLGKKLRVSKKENEFLIEGDFE